MPPSRPIRRALVTGASAGLGTEFARQLAARGTDLVLVARRAERLEALASELRDAADVDVEVVPADLADRADLARIAARLETSERPVDLLINGAGAGAYGDHADLDADRQLQLVDLNVTALVALTRAVLPRYLDAGAGAIVQVGSLAGFQPCPHAAVYGATKAFVRSFTAAVQEEVRGTGVRVLLLAPGITETEFQQVSGFDEGAVPSLARSGADEVVAAALRDLARQRRTSVPGALNRGAALASGASPSVLSTRISGLLHGRFAGSS